MASVAFVARGMVSTTVTITEAVSYQSEHTDPSKCARFSLNYDRCFALFFCEI